MSVYLVGNSLTEQIQGAHRIESSDDVKKGKEPACVTQFAVNGGPGAGKGSFEGAAIQHIMDSCDQDTVVVLVAEAARDVIDGLSNEGRFQEVLESGKLSEHIESEAFRRAEVADRLVQSLSGKNVIVIYDRDETNAAIYDIFFQCYDFGTEKLDEDKFRKQLSENQKINDLIPKMNTKYTKVFCTEPVRHEINYACAEPKVTGAKVDPTRKESYKMAKELHKALELGARHIYGDKMVVIPNTDTSEPSNAKETIRHRALIGIEFITTALESKTKRATSGTFKALIDKFLSPKQNTKEIPMSVMVK